ncbi:alpha-L-arabinofuranosidase 1 [Selaginella moellendorffii]|nr:alpha-L-arabinofuranosidase 1 [Selaginella moellendorffii]|eukprot:XP_002987233.2 alpha-L-arabinofuranosidase 1 [Selaginella moellendorffii]
MELLLLLPLVIFLSIYCAHGRSITMHVLSDEGDGTPIPSTLFGIFFEEINHAGNGGLWSELVSNRGFEAGGQNTPSNIAPWTPVGSSSDVLLATERASPFARNPIALRVEVLCDSCQAPVGVANPGYWGMDVRAGDEYKIIFWLKAATSSSVVVSFVSSDSSVTLAQSDTINVDGTKGWTKQEIVLKAQATDHYAQLTITSKEKTVFWIDQVSAMPVETYKGHGFRKDLALMLEELKPRFIRFPGGCYVEGERLQNAWRWRASVGPWEERPGHLGDVWGYWSDDGIGYFEFLQLAEDLDALPIWVFNNGVSHTDEVATSLIGPFVQEALDGLEFALGSSSSKYGALRAKMGHPEPFNLKYVAIGNEDCGKQYYRDNYLQFYYAIKKYYPDISIVTNCDGSYRQLDHPADLYDFHIYTSASNLFNMNHQFDKISRNDGPKAFVSEYAVTGNDAGRGSLLAALAEAAFLIGIERNSDVVHMTSYAPLFVNNNDRRWNPDSIVYDSWQSYGTPSYWVQKFFKLSSGATLLPSNITGSTNVNSVVTSAIRSSDTNDPSIIVKAVNFGNKAVGLKLNIDGSFWNSANSTAVILTSNNVMDENSFSNPTKVVPKTVTMSGKNQMGITLPAYSFMAITVPSLGSNSRDSELHSDM